MSSSSPGRRLVHFWTVILIHSNSNPLVILGSVKIGHNSNMSPFLSLQLSPTYIRSIEELDIDINTNLNSEVIVREYEVS